MPIPHMTQLIERKFSGDDGEHLGHGTIIGAGLVGPVPPGRLLSDKVSAGMTGPSLPGSLLMLAAGCAWGIYSLRGKGVVDPIRVTSGNFLRALPLAVALIAIALPWASLDRNGVISAIVSGALTSGVG